MAEGSETALEASVRSQLAAWHLGGTPEGAAALDIAHRLADEEIRPTAAAMLHGQLRALMGDLRALAPEEEARDDVADLQDEYKGLRVVGS